MRSEWARELKTVNRCLLLDLSPSLEERGKRRRKSIARRSSQRRPLQHYMIRSGRKKKKGRGGGRRKTKPHRCAAHRPVFHGIFSSNVKRKEGGEEKKNMKMFPLCRTIRSTPVPVGGKGRKGGGGREKENWARC